jgi:hypothetical protein
MPRSACFPAMIALLSSLLLTACSQRPVAAETPPPARNPGAAAAWDSANLLAWQPSGVCADAPCYQARLRQYAEDRGALDGLHACTVNEQKLMGGMPQAASMIASLKTTIDGKRAQMQQESDALMARAEEYRGASATMSEADRAQAMSDLEGRKAVWERHRREAEAELKGLADQFQTRLIDLQLQAGRLSLKSSGCDVVALDYPPDGKVIDITGATVDAAAGLPADGH